MIPTFRKSCPALMLSVVALLSADAARATQVNPDPEFVIASVNVNGAPNAAFSGDGVLLVGSHSCGFIAARDITISASRIYVTGLCGASSTWNGGSFVLKLLTNGSVDSTFGVLGLARIPGISAEAIVVDAGRPIIGGGQSGLFALARLNANGSSDATFGTGGVSVVNAPAVSGETISSMARQSDGKIVAVGSGTHATLGSVFVTGRFMTNGAPDTSFSADGWDNTDFTEGTTDLANDVAVGADGKIVVAGRTATFGTNDARMAVVRYATNGARDTTFSGDGKVALQVPGGTTASASGVGIDSSGRVALGGLAFFPDARFVVARLTSAGALDAAFGSGGFAPTNFASATGEAVMDLSMASATRILVAGDATVGGQDQLAAARYVSTGLDTTYDVDGKVLVAVPDFDVEARAVTHDTGSGVSYLLGTLH